MNSISISLTLLLCVSAAAHAATEDGKLLVREPVRMANGDPMVPIYFFDHWWDPWKSNDDVVRADLKKLRALGFNTLLIDHEGSQAMDGDFKWLDRSHRLAKEEGFAIVPWLSLKTFEDTSYGERLEWAQKRYGACVTTTKDGYLPYGPGTIEYGIKYTEEYLQRYADQALLYVMRDGKKCPVVSLTPEASWFWKKSMDPETNMHFSRWLLGKYGSVEVLNKSWGTKFKDVFDVDPSDEKVFAYDYAIAGAAREIPQPVRDHILFRARIVSDALAAIRAKLRQKYPDLLLLTEIPYAFADEHPHAWKYTIEHASIYQMADYADLIILRGTGALTQRSRQAISDYIDQVKKQVIVCHRIGRGHGPDGIQVKPGAIADLYAHEAAAYFNGIGYYSWNEMCDVHIVPNEGTNAPKDAGSQNTEADYKRLYGIVNGINKEYLSIYKNGLKEIEVPAAGIAAEGIGTIY